MFGRRLSKPLVATIAAVASAAIVAPAVFAAFHLDKQPSKQTLVVKRPCGDRIFGHVASLTQTGDHFDLRFDPAWFTSGVTANTAAAEDGAVPTGQPVPNDNYVVDESHRLLSYIVPSTAHVTILTREGTGPLGATPSTVAELEQIVNGGAHRPLFEPLDSGVWIRVHVDTVCALDQQYRP